MSYGKWKALHPHTDIEAPQVDDSLPRCKICGGVIKRKFAKLYCSDACEYEAQKIRSREYFRRKKERSLMENGQV